MESKDVATLREPPAEDLEPEDTLIGRTLDGRYRLIRRLGQGGMGAVYEAEYLKLESKVAIKILQASLSTNEKYRKRFLREARAASAIESDHIVRSTDFGATDDGLLYFAMELMEGQDLEQYLQSCSRIEWWRFEPLLSQVTDAVGAAHKRGVIHRDIKPSNCFLCNKDSSWPPLVKVLDFGIAKLTPSANDGESPVATLETLTATNELFGTIAYMAPEIIEGQPADARSDIYALGVMMFRALTGKLPFTSPNVYKVLQQHVATPVPSLRALVPDIPAAVESVVFRAMAKQPDHRYQSINELEVALQAAHKGVIEPSAAALSGHTQAVQRDAISAGLAQAESASTSFDRGPDATATTDSDALASTRDRAPRTSPLAMLGLALIVSGATAAAVFAWVDSSKSEPVAAAEPARDRAPEASTPKASKAAEAPTAAPASALTEVQAERAGIPDPAPVSESPAAASPPSSRKKQPDVRKPTAAPPQPRSIHELAGEQCPEAIGGHFTIEGLLGGHGKYIKPTVTGEPKASRKCIEAFIRTRSFGKGSSMKSHTEQLDPQ